MKPNGPGYATFPESKLVLRHGLVALPQCGMPDVGCSSLLYYPVFQVHSFVQYPGYLNWLIN